MGRSDRALSPAVRRARWFVKRHSTVHRDGGEPPVIVASLPRSGSTWLLEIVATQPGMRVINEPFFVPRFDGIADPPLRPSWDELLPSPERERRLGAYVDALFDNRLGVGSPSPFTAQHRLRTHRVVCKILRCHDLLGWLESRYGARIVFLMRHPLAVAASRREHPLLELLLGSDAWCERFLGSDLRRRALEVVGAGPELDRMVLDWCLQSLPAVRHADRSRWFCVHYEDMVAHPEGCIDALADSLDLEDREAMHRQNRVPSRSTFLSDDETRRRLGRDGDRRFLLDKWRGRIAEGDERRALRLAAEFGLDLYAPGHLEPVRRLEPGFVPSPADAGPAP